MLGIRLPVCPSISSMVFRPRPRRAAEQLLYAQLLRRRMGLISVGHRPSLRLYHDRLLELDGRWGWGWGWTPRRPP
jgi:ABC-type uncharacterized transport system fused permease/ATPase subunit